MPTDTYACHGCQEFRQLSRRRFLELSPLAGLAAMTAPAWLPRVALAGDASSRDVLISIFLRGGMDGLTAITPYGDPHLYSARPTLAIQPPGAPDGATDLDGFFGLAPSMLPLLPAYQSGQLAFVHAVGSPDTTRSHFESMVAMEFATPNQTDYLLTGWLARHMMSVPPLSDGLLRAVALGGFLPATLYGAPASLPVAQPRDFSFPGQPETRDEREAVLQMAYAAAGEPMRSTAVHTFNTIDLLATIDFNNYTPQYGASYPTSRFGTALKSAAALIKSDIGVEAIAIDMGNFDTHAVQGVLDGELASLLTDMSLSLAAFHLDMQDRMDQITLAAISEFGRRVYENGSAGTDHGHGGAMIVMGGHIVGNRVLTNWPGLHPDQLYEERDLAITIDYRDILAEILYNRAHNRDLSTVFPNFTPAFRGVTDGKQV